jgi:hypothetical protein
VVAAVFDGTTKQPTPTIIRLGDKIMEHKVFRVDEEVHAALRQRAIELHLRPNDVLRQLLGLPVREPTARPGAGQSIPHPQLEIPILRALQQFGGSAKAHEVIEKVGQMLAFRLSDADRQELGDGQTRWRLRCNVARMDLIKRGHLNAGSARGTWEVTDLGLERLRRAGDTGEDSFLAAQPGAPDGPPAAAVARSSFASPTADEATAPPAGGYQPEATAKRSTTHQR